MEYVESGEAQRFEAWLAQVDVLCERYKVDRETLIAIVFETNPEVNQRMLYWPSGGHNDFYLIVEVVP